MARAEAPLVAAERAAVAAEGEVAGWEGKWAPVSRAATRAASRAVSPAEATEAEGWAAERAARKERWKRGEKVLSVRKGL